ncbi:MAG: hypothetical protein K4571_15435 [Deltaproteobacteria bacterium]
MSISIRLIFSRTSLNILALKEAQHFGVKTFCITVDRTAAEYLPRMESHNSWTVIDDVVKLPEKITRIYRMLTA